MQSRSGRYGPVSILLHWLLAVASLVLLGLGWRLWSSPMATPQRAFLSQLHVSLGLSAGAILLVAILLRLFVKRPGYPKGFPLWRRLLGWLLNTFIYVAFIALIATGYLREAFAGWSPQFWGITLPPLVERNDDFAQLSERIHGLAAAALGGLIVAHIGLVAFNSLASAGFAGRMTPWGGAEPPETTSLLGSKTAQKLAGKMRLFGQIEFWIQFVIAFISALLLQFANAGRALSAAPPGFGEAIYWAGVSLALLFVSCLLGIYFARAGGKVAERPENFLGGAGRASFWFLGAGMGLSSTGLILSLVGVALSITLLIAKTVSQPPGIAITDPSKIIRALDVFVLLVNFILLIAHFIGAGVALWLSIAVSQARSEYRATSAQAQA